MLGRDPTGGHGRLERLEVALVLVGVGDGEADHRLVEHHTLAEVGGDPDPIAGPSVGAGQRPPAQAGIAREQRPGVIVSTSGEYLPSHSWRT